MVTSHTVADYSSSPISRPLSEMGGHENPNGDAPCHSTFCLDLESGVSTFNPSNIPQPNALSTPIPVPPESAHVRGAKDPINEPASEETNHDARDFYTRRSDILVRALEDRRRSQFDLEKFTSRSEKDSSSTASTHGSEYSHTLKSPVTHHLPKKAGNRPYRYLRWNFFSVYRWLFTLAFLPNAAILIALVGIQATNDMSVNLDWSITAAAANFCASIIARHEHFVNFLFRMSGSLPKTFPLWLRAQAAKIHHYGGLHSGCSVAGTLWYILFSITLAIKHAKGEMHELPVMSITWTIVALLCIMLVFSYPSIRFKVHNHFEAIHRFAGWTIIALFWVQVGLVVEWKSRTVGKSISRTWIETPSSWFLICMTLCVIYPWARLRPRKVQTECLSDHAVRLHFDYTTPKGCSAVKISDEPLKETHAFAVIPEAEGQKGYSIIVSDAGDWTRRLIRNPPKHIYTRGAPQRGVIYAATMFKSVVIVTTGSGIGPCLGLFNEFPNLPCRVLWSTPNPETTYGAGVIDAVKKADPTAQIIDTRKSGRQDMVAASYQLYRESGAEAVVVISNSKLTWKIVYGLETRGVPAYGPIWDC